MGRATPTHGNRRNHRCGDLHFGFAESGAAVVRTKCSCPSLVSSGFFVPVAIRRGFFCCPSGLCRVSARGCPIGKSYGRSPSGCTSFSGSIGVSWADSSARRGRRSWKYFGSYSACDDVLPCCLSQHSVVSCVSSRHLDSSMTLGREAGRSDPVDWCDHAVKFVILARVFRAGLGGDDRQRLAYRNDFRTWRLEPTVRGRARNTLSNSVINLVCRSDENPKSMVKSTLNPSRGYHDSMIVISARESNRKDENSRKKVQNIVTVSTVDSQSPHIPGVRRRRKNLP